VSADPVKVELAFSFLAPDFQHKNLGDSHQNNTDQNEAL
jgi:hypothetical protein